MGRIYEEGINILSAAFPELEATYPNLELVYLGKHAEVVPTSLRSHVLNLGYVSDPVVVEEQLSNCHLAYLCGPYILDYFGRFSFPSRTTDYLMAGLPIIAHIGRNTATEQILRPLDEICVYKVENPHQISDAIRFYTANVEIWNNASNAASEFARENFSIDAIRSTVLSHLEQASRCPAA